MGIIGFARTVLSSVFSTKATVPSSSVLIGIDRLDATAGHVEPVDDLTGESTPAQQTASRWYALSRLVAAAPCMDVDREGIAMLSIDLHHAGTCIAQAREDSALFDLEHAHRLKESYNFLQAAADAYRESSASCTSSNVTPITPDTYYGQILRFTTPEEDAVSSKVIDLFRLRLISLLNDLPPKPPSWEPDFGMPTVNPPLRKDDYLLG